MAAGHGFGQSPRWWAEQVAEGNVSRAEAERALSLEPGEHLAPTGVITGSGAHPGIPRHGADETDQDYADE